MAINEAYLKQLRDHCQGAYGPLHNQIKDNRALRFGRHEINVPAAYKSSTTITRSPIIADILLRVTATLTTDQPVIKVPPYGNTDKAKRNSNQRERWSQAAMRQMQTEARRPIFRMGIDNAVSDGIGVWKCVDRLDVWQGLMARKPDEQWDDNLSLDENAKRATKYLERTEKHKKGSKFPFVWMDVDPLTYYESPTGYGEFEVLEITKRPALPTMERFGVWRDSNKGFKRGRKLGEPMPNDGEYGGQTMELTEYWQADGSAVVYMLDNEIVETRKLNYPRPPYFRLGGHMTSSREPSEQFHSIVQPFAHLIPTLDSMLTMSTNRMYLFAYPFLRKKEARQQIWQQGPEDPTDVTDIKPGDVLENVEFMGEIGPSTILNDMIGHFMQMIDRSGLASVMRGQGASLSSGYMVSQLMTAAQLVYAPIVENAKMALEQMIPFIWQLIERRNMGRVYVCGAGESRDQSEWLGLAPDDIDGYYACEVVLKPKLPLDEIAERASAANMVRDELWSRRFALEHLGHEQPEEILDEVEVEGYVRSPEVRGSMARKVAEKAGLVEPAPPAPPALPPEGQPPGLVDQFGNPMPTDGGMGGGGMPTGVGINPSIPGLNFNPVPPPPGNAGMTGIPGLGQ